MSATVPGNEAAERGAKWLTAGALTAVCGEAVFLVAGLVGSLLGSAAASHRLWYTLFDIHFAAVLCLVWTGVVLLTRDGGWADKDDDVMFGLYLAAFFVSIEDFAFVPAAVWPLPWVAVPLGHLLRRRARRRVDLRKRPARGAPQPAARPPRPLPRRRPQTHWRHPFNGPDERRGEHR